MAETASPMHCALPSAPQQSCETCGASFAKRRSWGRFCGNQCRNAFHAAEGRKEAIRKRALGLYEALATLAAQGVPVAVEAIKGLKPPAEPKELLK